MYLPCLLPMFISIHYNNLKNFKSYKDYNNNYNDFCIDLICHMNNQNLKRYKQFIKDEINLDFEYPLKINRITYEDSEFNKLCAFIYNLYKLDLDKSIIRKQDFNLNDIESKSLDYFLSYNDIKDLYTKDIDFYTFILVATLFGFYTETDEELVKWSYKGEIFIFLSIKDFYEFYPYKVPYFDLSISIGMYKLNKIYPLYMDDCKSYKKLIQYQTWNNYIAKEKERK